MMGGPFYGTAIVFTPPGRWDETTHLELTAKHRIATWTGVPTMYWRLLEHPDFDSYDLTCVTAISSGGAPFPPELIRLLQETFPGVGVSQGYGASETMGAGTLSFGPLMEHHPDAVGRATPAIDIQIRDDDGNVLGVGEVGEICIRSAVRVPRVLGQPRGHRRGVLARSVGTAPATSAASTTACCSSRVACAT